MKSRKELLSKQTSYFIKLWAICFFVSLSTVGVSQEELPRHYKTMDMVFGANGFASKTNGNTNTASNTVSKIIQEKEATWLRLFFKDVNLGEKSTMTITSLLDGGTQTLNAKTIKEWSNSTAYFNGDQIEITLTIAPNEKNINFTVEKLGIGDVLNVQKKSQCGARDDRRDSNNKAIGRIVPIGCTGWIIRNGRFVTAGHCLDSRAQLIEFNVPKSNPDKSFVHPGPEDQYPIGNFVTNYVRGRAITDWGVFRAGANTITGLTPIQAQGRSFNVTRNAPGRSIRITGYGNDTGIDSNTQQTHKGPLSSFDNNFVRYKVDTKPGNSGSPIIDVSTGNALGVHAYGGCRTNGNGSNYGERATLPEFWEAMGLDDGRENGFNSPNGDTSNFTEGVSVSSPESSVILDSEGENPFKKSNLYPNPTSNIFSITVGKLANAKAHASIYNILGQKQRVITLKEGDNSFKINELKLTTGMYLIEIKSTNGFSKAEKLVIN